MSTEAARTRAEDWASYAAWNGPPDGYAPRHIRDARFDVGYRRGWREARIRAVS